VGSPQEAPAFALILCSAIVAAAGTISVNSLMNVANYSVSTISPANRPTASLPQSAPPARAVAFKTALFR
jgi:hypothetical protein